MAMYVLFWVGQNYIVVLLCGWLNNAVIRYVPERPALLAYYIRLARRTVVLVACAGSLVALAVYSVVRDYEAELIWLVFVIAGSSAFGLGLNLLRAAFSHGTFSATAIATPCIQVILLLVLLPRSGSPVATALMSMALGYIPVVLWQALRLQKTGYGIKSELPITSHGLFRRSVLYGFPLTLYQFGMAVLQTGDRYIIAPLVSAEELGIYAFWAGLGLQIGKGISSLIFPVINPRLNQTWGQDPQRAVFYVRRMVLIYLAAIGPLVVAIGFIVPPVLATIGIQPQYAAGSHLIWYGLVSMILLGLIQFVGKRREFLEDTKSYAVAALIGSLSMALCDLVLVPSYGVIGAGSGLVAGYIAAAIVMFWAAYRMPKNRQE